MPDYSAEAVRDFEVVGDTLIANVPALIVASRSVTTMRSVDEGPQPGTTMVGTMQGTEQGQFYFSSERGLLLGRMRSGEVQGEIVFEGLPQPMSMKQQMRFTGTLTWLAP